MFKLYKLNKHDWPDLLNDTHWFLSLEDGFSVQIDEGNFTFLGPPTSLETINRNLLIYWQYLGSITKTNKNNILKEYHKLPISDKQNLAQKFIEFKIKYKLCTQL